MSYNANKLINTKSPAPRQLEMLLASMASADYFYARPYPRHAFGPMQWTPDKGPIPTALPYVQTIVNESAEFIFKNGNPSFSVTDNEDASILLNDIIEANGLNAKWVSLAQSVGLNGAIAVKFSIDMENTICPIRITFLDMPTECRVFIDPHDSTNILMARIQYPYRDPSDGNWYYFREEWTSDFYITYHPLLAGDKSISDVSFLPGYLDHLGDDRDFVIKEQEINPLGLIPVTIIRNRMVKGNPLGEGDCWTAFRIIDRLALTMHGEDRANQFHTQPVTVFMNAEPDNVGALSPGEPVAVQTLEGSTGTADVKLLSHDGKAREWTHKDIEKWEQLLYNSVGLSLVNPETVSNKGSMSEQVLKLLYQRTIATTDHKRELWGNSGMCVFFHNLLLGLSRLGGFKELVDIAPRTKVICVWPDYFAPTDGDLSTTTNRTISQMNNDLITHEKAIERIGRAENLDDSEILLMKPILLNQKIAKQSNNIGILPEMTATDDISEMADIDAASGYNNFTE